MQRARPAVEGEQRQLPGLLAVADDPVPGLAAFEGDRALGHARQSTLAMWTQFPELDELLRELVEGVRGVLGENLVGVYLQGSFAVGGADEWSDADFLVVTERPLGETSARRSTSSTGGCSRCPGTGPKHLEGSYVDRELLRPPDPRGRSSSSSTTARRSSRGTTTATPRTSAGRSASTGSRSTGPPPDELVDPVPPDVLREEARARLPEWVEWAESIERWNRWYGPYLVLGALPGALDDRARHGRLEAGGGGVGDGRSSIRSGGRSSGRRSTSGPTRSAAGTRRPTAGRGGAGARVRALREQRAQLIGRDVPAARDQADLLPARGRASAPPRAERRLRARSGCASARSSGRSPS